MIFLEHIYDVIIIGGGPAGYTAALYCTRAGMDTVILEKFSAGGQMTQTSQIDNYPGFDDGIDGFTLGYKMQTGAEKYGAKTIQAEVTSVNLTQKIKTVTYDSGILYGKTVIIATGADHRHLGLSEEQSLIGKGVAYCATCDGMFYKGKTVVVIGGGNSAAADALYLSKICKNVIVIHRRDTLRAAKIYHDPLMSAQNVEFIWNSTVEQMLYDDFVNGVRIKNSKTGEIKNIACDGVFISIGRNPETKIFKQQIDVDDNGYIIADESTKTNIPGVFAIGDVRTKAVRQIVTAVSDGANAAQFAEQYLNDFEN